MINISYSHILLGFSISTDNALSKALLSASQLALTGGLVLSTTSFQLVDDVLFAELLSLLFVNGFNENTLVLVDVTLNFDVEFMVQIAINLLAISVFLKQAAQDTKAAHPENLGGQTSLASTTALTVACVATLGLGLGSSTSAGSGVHVLWLANDETILDELSHVLSCG